MSRKSKRKAGAGAIAARILVIVLFMVVGGIGSFFASKTFFANRFKKDKKAEIAAQLKEESKERVDVALVQAGDSMMIRIYHNKNQQLIFVPLRADMELDLTKDGQQAILDEIGTEKEKATISEMLKTGKNGNLLKEQVENTLGISINTYELMTQKQFVKLMNKAGEIKVDFDEDLTYEDLTEKSVTLSAGENTLNGNVVFALLTETNITEDKEAHNVLAGDIIVAVSKAIGKKSLSEYKEYVKEYYDTVKSNTKYSDVEGFLKRIRQVRAKDMNYKILEGTESGESFIVDKEEAKKVFDQILSEGGDLSAALTTTEKAKDDEKDSSKEISIEIQNSTQISGLAGRWRDKLAEDGYSVGSVKTNREGTLTHTKIIIAKEGMAKDLKSYFKNPEFEVGTVESGAEICIVLGTEDEI
jgi:anionic cell wall polymer biosynthesis LytR-Cps2A-Psr (LCP) family protein